MRCGTRFANSICIAAIFAFCLYTLFSFTKLLVPLAHAKQNRITGSVSSSPSSGPVGATISVSGSGWKEPDGEQVSLGYMIESYCSTDSGAQASSFQNGSFSGSFRLPDGTPMGTYLICATFGTTTAVGNSYTILTESSPKISIALSLQPGTQQATVSGSNYYPAGTRVNLFWETTTGKVIFTIAPVVSNSGGLISKTFTVPTSITSGAYKIAATIHGQPALTSSVSFTFKAPTPSPTPSPTPDPKAMVSPTVVATKVATPLATRAVSATTPPGSQHNGQTPSSDASINDAKMTTVIIAASAGVLAIIATFLFVALFIRRKKARALHMASLVRPDRINPMTWQNFQTTDMPYPTQNGSMPAPLPRPVTPAPPSPQPLQMSPYVHLLQQPEAGHSNPTNETNGLAPGDPQLESIKQQVQKGLFATPGMRRDG